MWYYQNKEFTSEMIGDHIGFVYLITNLSNGMKYIGKKKFISKTKLPPLKGKTRKRTKITESDWMKYYGSNEILKNLVEETGQDGFHREILRLCKTTGEMSYFEAKEQFDREVLLREDYYNNFIGCKIHGTHLKGLK